MEDKQILCVGLVVLDIINVMDKYPEWRTRTAGGAPGPLMTPGAAAAPRYARRCRLQRRSRPQRGCESRLGSRCLMTSARTWGKN